MSHRAIALIALCFLIAGMPACAQSIRTGGLENLALEAEVSASSSATDHAGKYGAPRAVDGNSGSRWATSGGAEPPQWLELTWPEPVTVSTIVLAQSSAERIYANAQQIELSFSEDDPVEVELEDTWAGQIIRFEPRETTSLRLTMLSAYEQKTYLGISELSVFHDPDGMVTTVTPPRQRWDNPDLTAHGRDVHPCVNKTPDDVERALRNIERYENLDDWVQSMQAKADRWLERSDDWILEMLPEPGAAFAYGFTGCPICGASWGRWKGARCSWDNPGHVTCANGHVLPDAEHPDPGTGYVGEYGRTHYFVGSWNAWVVENLQFDALRPLCLTYLLTKDERYAHKAAFILDAIARIYPECDAGSWDYPSDPPSGRLCRPWYQVARVLIHYVDFYDEIYTSPALDTPSLVEYLTKRENIQKNLLRNGAWYCYEQSLKGGLHNGEADYIRGALAVGCVLGIDYYVDWALDGPYGIRTMIANNADRDGRYFETSLSYALHARNLYLTFAEPMINYRSEEYPDGIDLYADPKFLSFYFLPAALFDCAGHSPRYGDTGPDTRMSRPTDPVFSSRDYGFAEVCYARTEGARRERFASALAYLADERGEDIRSSMGDRMWMLFHAGEFPESAEAGDTRERLTSSDFFGQKGIAILRGGDDDQAQAALVRYGPSLNHGHYDDLNLNYYALGHEVTYDLGYGLGSTHTQVGWAKQTASHNLVVVDEQRQMQAPGGSGGSLLLTADMPGLKAVEAEASAAYLAQGVDRYQRMVALVGSGGDRYLVDVFRVNGGSQHDYMLHALSDDVAVEGVDLGEPLEGSLAGPEYRWGAMQGNDGDMKGHPNKPYWNPPPGNGYGFLMNPRRGEASGAWEATWQIDPAREARLRAIGLPESGTELITARAPGIYPHLPNAAYVCARRTGEDLASTWVTILEPTERPPAQYTLRAGKILAAASLTGGTSKSVADGSIALFKAESAGDRMVFETQIPEAGEYIVTVRHYLSPGYGTARLYLDGEPLGEAFRGTAANVAPARPRELDTVELEAGRHELALELVEPSAEGGTWWMGLTSIGFQPADTAQRGPVEARIVSADRLESTPEGGVGVRVVGRDGVEDRIFSAPDAVQRDYGDGYACNGQLARVRTDEQGLVSAELVAGARLQTPEMTLRFPRSAWQGEVIAVDNDAREVVVSLEDTGSLPEGDALRGTAIYFGNPDYSRNTAYHIDSVTRTGDRVRIRVREATFRLGKAIVDGPPLDGRTLTSVVPHSYARPRGNRNVSAEADFFAGKLLTGAEGAARTTVRRVRDGQPTEIEVDSVEGFTDGTVCHYHDVQPGDKVTVHCSASISRAADGTYRLRSVTPVTFGGAGTVQFQRGTDGWVTAEEETVPAGFSGESRTVRIRFGD